MKMYNEDCFAYLYEEKQNKQQQSNISNVIGQIVG